VVEVVSDFACVAAAAWATRMQRMESMTLNPVISVGHPVVSAVVSSELCGRQRQHPPRIWCTYLHCTFAIVSAAATRADITNLFFPSDHSVMQAKFRKWYSNLPSDGCSRNSTSKYASTTTAGWHVSSCEQELTPKHSWCVHCGVWRCSDLSAGLHYSRLQSQK